MRLLVSLAFVGSLAAQSWPSMKEDVRGTAYQPLRGYIVTPSVKWSAPLPEDCCWYHAPTIADVDDDGLMEVLAGDVTANTLYVFDGATGTLKWSYAAGGDIESSAHVLDVDGDGATEVVLCPDNGVITALNGATGAAEWTYATGGYTLASVTCADVDGDGALEVLASCGSTLYCVDGVTGALEWSYAYGNTSFSTPMAADVDGDGQVEVVAGRHGNAVVCVDGATGVLEWTGTTTGNVYGSVAIADVDGDGALEVVTTDYTGTVTCFSGATGAIEWTYGGMGSFHANSPAVHDIDGDGVVEVAFASNGSNLATVVSGVTGALKWNFNTGAYHQGMMPAMADVNATPGTEVLFANKNGDLYCLDAAGNVLWTFVFGPGPNAGGSMAVGDVDNDSCAEIVLRGGTSNQTLVVVDDPVNNAGCSPTGIGAEESGASPRLYLRAEGRALVFATGVAGRYSLVLYAADGRALVRRDGRSNGAERRLSLAALGLPAGVYVARLTTAGGAAVTVKAAVAR